MPSRARALHPKPHPRRAARVAVADQAMKQPVNHRGQDVACDDVDEVMLLGREGRGGNRGGPRKKDWKLALIIVQKTQG